MKLKLKVEAKYNGLASVLEDHFPLPDGDYIDCACGDSLGRKREEWAKHVASLCEDEAAVVEADFVADAHGIRQQGDAILEAHPRYELDEHDNGYDVTVTVETVED